MLDTHGQRGTMAMRALLEWMLEPETERGERRATPPDTDPRVNRIDDRWWDVPPWSVPVKGANCGGTFRFPR